MLPIGNRCPASNTATLFIVARFSLQHPLLFPFRFISNFSTPSGPAIHSTLALERCRLPPLPAVVTILSHHDVGSGLPTRETNSARTGYYLWGAGQGFAITRRGENRGQGYGSDPIWKRHSMAPRCRRPGETADPRAVRLSTTQTARK